jgi:hypothetical protein
MNNEYYQYLLLQIFYHQAPTNVFSKFKSTPQQECATAILDYPIFKSAPQQCAKTVMDFPKFKSAAKQDIQCAQALMDLQSPKPKKVPRFRGSLSCEMQTIAQNFYSYLLALSFSASTAQTWVKAWMQIPSKYGITFAQMCDAEQLSTIEHLFVSNTTVLDAHRKFRLALHHFVAFKHGVLTFLNKRQTLSQK